MLEKKIQKLAVYLQNKKFPKLKEESEKILKKAPNAVQALQYAGIALLMMQRYEEAKVYLDKALAMRPKDGPILDTFANFYYVQRDYEQALKYQKRSLDNDPNNPDGLEKLGDIYGKGGNPFKAILAYKDSYLRGNRDPEMIVRLAKMLRVQGRVEEAQEVLDKVIDNPKAQFEQINIYVELGDVDKGIEQANKVLNTIATNKAELIHVFKELGEMNKAKEIALECRDKSLPGSALDAISFGMVEEDWLENYVAKYPEEKISKNILNKYYFSLASYYKKKDKSRWFSYLQQANSVKESKAQHFDLEKELSLLNKVISTHKNVKLSPSTLETSVPIFIVGMPRSGTTLTETIIGTHSYCKHIGESSAMSYSLKRGAQDELFEGLDGLISYLDDIEHLDVKAVGEDYIRIVRNHSRSAKHLVDKMPHNFLHVGVIAKAFPNAKIIHCRRSPIDTCLSIFEQNFKGFHSYGNNLDTLIPYYKKYQEIMAYWKESLPEGSFYESDYEALTSNPEEEVRKLLDYCGLPFEQQCLEFNKQKRTVKTASVEQVRKGIYQSSQNRWQGIEEEIKPLLDAFPEYVA